MGVVFSKHLKIMLLFSILFLVCQPGWAVPTIEGTPDSAKEGVSYYFRPDFTGDQATAVFTIIPNPEDPTIWADFDTSTGSLSSKQGYPIYPRNENVGIYNFQIKVQDKDGEVTQDFSIEVKNTDNPPTLTNVDGTPITALTPAKEGAGYSFDLLASDDDLKITSVGEELSFELVGAPEWLTIVPGAPDAAAGTLLAQLTLKNVNEPPGDLEAGKTYSVQIVVIDKEDLADTENPNIGLRAAIGPFDLVVENVNDEPVFDTSNPTSLTLSEGGSLSFTPAYKDLDDHITGWPGVTFTATMDGAELPGWLEIDSATGELRTTATKTTNTELGSRTIAITVSDGIDPDPLDSSMVNDPTLPLTLCVKNKNDAPEYQTEPVNTTLGQAYVITDYTNVPAITSIPENYTDNEGISYSIALDAVDTDIIDAKPLADGTCVIVNDKLTYTITEPELLPWAKIIPDPADANKALLVNLEGRPNNDDVGTYPNIQIVVTDGQGGSDQLTTPFTIEITNKNDQPYFTQTPTKVVTAYEDQAIEFTPVISRASTPTNIIKANDIDIKWGDELYYSISQEDPANPGQFIAAPEWLGITKISNKEAQLTGVPKQENVGLYQNIVVTVSDRNPAAETPDPDLLTNTYKFDINVVAVNDLPQFTEGFGPAEAQTISIDARTIFPAGYSEIRATDADDNDIVTFSLTEGPAWMSVDNAGSITDDTTGEVLYFKGIIKGTPENSDVTDSTPVKITARDNAGGTTVLSFNVKVNYVNKIPKIGDITDTTWTEDIAKEVRIKVDDDPDAGLKAVLTGQPSWLSARIDGLEVVLSGTPLPKDIATTNGINLTVTDKDGATDSRTFSVTVLAENDPPIISGALPVGYVGSAYTFTPTVYDEDTEPSKITFSLNTDAAWLTINPLTGVLSGTPDAAGDYNVTIKVFDGNEDGQDSLITTLKVLASGTSIIPGNIDGSFDETGENQTIDLADAIIGLQLLSNVKLSVSIADPVTSGVDVNDDNKIGLEETIFILKTVATPPVAP